MVLVSGHARSGNRLFPGRRAAHCRSLHLRPDDRSVDRRVVGRFGRRPEVAGRCSMGAGGRSHGRHHECRCCARASRVLVRQHLIVGARDAGHSRQLHRLRESGPGLARARAARRSSCALSAGARVGACGIAGLSGCHLQQPRAGQDASGQRRHGTRRIRSGGTVEPAFRRSAEQPRERPCRRGQIRRGSRPLSSGCRDEAPTSRKRSLASGARWSVRTRPKMPSFPIPRLFESILVSRRLTMDWAGRWRCWGRTTGP
jgi:hypothetical protein